MILRQATIKYKGYDPEDLSKGSHKRICVACDNCGKVKYVEFRHYKDLCEFCIRFPKKPKFVNEQDRFIPNTGIDRIATIKQYEYDPIDLSHGSQRKVIIVCQDCGKVREIRFNSYRDLCTSCTRLGKNNWAYGLRGKLAPAFGHIAWNKNKTSKDDSRILSGKNSSMFGVHKYGKDSPAYGYKHSKEQNKNHSKFMKENNPQFGKTGESGAFYGHKHNIKTRIKQSCSHQGITYDKWDGFINKDRSYRLHESQCTKLNKRFEGSEGHHLMSGVIVYIPHNLHRNIKHSMKTGKNMKEINKLALNYLGVII